ncbi:MAG TPA: IS110 family transposase [Acidimicrobiales bacterium]|nr:IS110 family transposase [Acidimicrobiales bacterium]
MPIVEVTRPVVGGVDTHLDVHVAAVVDPVGGLLGVESFPTTPAGYHDLAEWLESFGPVERVGVEGTGTYGAGLARHLSASGVAVVEVDRPNRQARRRNGKSDELDAIEAARAALSGRASGMAKAATGNVEALRTLLVAKRSARSIRIKTIGQLRHLVVTAPDDLRGHLGGLSTKALIRQAGALRPRTGSHPVRHAIKTAIVSLARRVQAINTEIAALDAQIETLVRATAPALLDVYGAGPDTAAILLTAAGDNPGRIRSEAAWAKICGVAPVPAGSGKTNGRHRLNQGGNRQANHALWRIVLTRLGQGDPRTVAYMQRRLAEGRTKPEIIRALKRYVAREIFPRLPT